MIQLHSIVQAGGRLYISCSVLRPNGKREGFRLTETSREAAFETLKTLRAEIDAVHPRGGNSGAKRD